ncbi:MAG: hypothetical protein HPY79_06190 [Bacteroidales bacterium]|nr:hypothetical protein [Bacteroidales bacterium]
MKKLKTLYISFENEIKINELYAFRSAIIEKAGRNHILFHNHLDAEKYLYRYPQIQYKIINNKPSLLCLEKGIDEIHHFFIKPSWDLQLYNRTYEVKVRKLQVNQFTMQVWDHVFVYNLYRWNPLSQNNYVKFKELQNSDHQKQMLQKILIGNILSFAKGIEWTIDKEIKVELNYVSDVKWLRYKQNKLACFDVQFKSNVFLPNYIGLGKHASLGFGIVKQLKGKKNE